MIQFNCPGCQAPYSVSDAKAGKSGKCPKCQTPFTVPQAMAAAPQPRDEDAEPPRKAARPRDEEDEDDRPRKKASRREEDEDESDELPTKRRARRDEGYEEDEHPRIERKPRPALSPLDGALKLIRRSQLLVLIAAGSLLLLGLVSVLASQLRLDSLTDDVLPWAMAVLPAIFLAASAVFASLGRFRVRGLSVRGNVSLIFLLTGLLSALRILFAVGMIALAVWSLTYTRRGPVEAVAVVVQAAALTFYIGMLIEAFTLPGLALLGSQVGTSEEQLAKIGFAAAFYPFFLLLVVGAGGLVSVTVIVVRVPELLIAVPVVLLFAAVHVVQYLVLSRAYRFPPATDAVS